jgi:cytochrome oxidase Cu insertion factor (SCO1/SenC/PrrC family)
MIRIQTFLFVAAAVLVLLAGSLVFYADNRFSGLGDNEAALSDIGGPFQLIDQEGHLRSDKDFRGRYVLLYFGYTYCPDVCPTTLEAMADALTKIGLKSDGVVPVFITLDPERDKPAVLKRYMAAFGSRFVGLTGSLGDITSIAHAYRVYFAKHPLPGGGYSVDHSSTLYLLGPDGKLVTFYDASTDSAAIAKDLRARLS